jgi:hypothetical protein
MVRSHLVGWCAIAGSALFFMLLVPTAPGNSRCPTFVTGADETSFVAVKRRSCKSARHIAIAWSRRSLRSPSCDSKGDRCRAAGVQCLVLSTHEDEGVVFFDVRCSPGRRSVRFDAARFPPCCSEIRLSERDGPPAAQR